MTAAGSPQLPPTTLHIEQKSLGGGKHTIQLTLERPGQFKLSAKAEIEFALTPQEQEELRWYMEDYLTRTESVEEVQIEQIEQWMKRRGVELYESILEGNRDVQRVFDRVLDQLADLRVEITTGVTEAASIPWELMRDPQSEYPPSARTGFQWQMLLQDATSLLLAALA